MPETINHETEEQEIRKEKINRFKKAMSPDVIGDLFIKSPNFEQVARQKFRFGSTRFLFLLDNKYKITGKSGELKAIKENFSDITFEDGDNGISFDNSSGEYAQISNWAAEGVKESILESLQNNGENIDSIIALAEQLKLKKQEKDDKKNSLKSELEEIERNYGLEETKEALNENNIDKDKAVKKHFKLKFGAFKRVWWKLGNAFGINQGGWQERASHDEQAGVDLEKKVKLRKLMGEKKGWEMAAFWNSVGGKDFFRERDKLWKVEELEKMERELSETTKVLGELLSLSVKIDRQAQNEGREPQSDSGPGQSQSDDSQEEAEVEAEVEKFTSEEPMSDEEAQRREAKAQEILGKDLENLKNKVDVLVSVFGDEKQEAITRLGDSLKEPVLKGWLNIESIDNNELIAALENKDKNKAIAIIEKEIDRNDFEDSDMALGNIIDKINILFGGQEEKEKTEESREKEGNEYEEQLKNLIGEEHFTESPKKPEEKIDMSIYDKNPNKIFEELADALGAEEYIKRKEERDIMHEFADALNSKESSKKSAEPLKGSKPRKDDSASRDEEDDSIGNQVEPLKGYKESEKILSGIFTKTDKGFIYKPGENINGKEVVYVINRNDSNLKAGKIKDGDEHSFRISKHTQNQTDKEGKVIYRKGDDWIIAENEDQIVYAVWVQLSGDDENRNIGTKGEKDKEPNGNVRELDASKEELKKPPVESPKATKDTSKEKASIDDIKAILKEKRKNLGLDSKGLKRINNWLNKGDHDKVIRFISQEVTNYINKNKNKINIKTVEEERDKIIGQIKSLETKVSSEDENPVIEEEAEIPSPVTTGADDTENEPKSERDQLIDQLEGLFKETKLTVPAKDGILLGLRNGRALNIENIKKTVAGKTKDDRIKDEINGILDKLKVSTEPDKPDSKKKV